MDNIQILQINLEECIKELRAVLQLCQDDKNFKILDKHIMLLKTIGWIKEDLIVLRGKDGVTEQ